METSLVPQQQIALREFYERCRELTENSVTNPLTKAAYGHSIKVFWEWFEATQPMEFTKDTIQKYKSELVKQIFVRRNRITGREVGVPASSSYVNKHLTAVRKFFDEAADNGWIDRTVANAIRKVKGVERRGQRLGNWLTREQAQRLLNLPDGQTLKGLRDQAILAVFLGAGLRRIEAAQLQFDQIQQREGRWLIVNLLGKHGRVRQVPIASWVKAAIDRWTQSAQVIDGHLFRSVNKAGKIGQRMTSQALYDVVLLYASELNDALGLINEGCIRLAPHDMRRTFAKLARSADAKIEQIQQSLGHASILTTERYLGTTQDLQNAPSDRIRLSINAKLHHGITKASLTR